MSPSRVDTSLSPLAAAPETSTSSLLTNTAEPATR